MELSLEEKKAIEILKKLQKKTPYIIWEDGTPYNKSNQIQTILNLIEKLQKEIEDLKETNNDNAEKSLLNDIFIKKNYISKDKIKERKKWYEDTCEHLSKNGIDLNKYDQYQGAIELCEELLEEK